MSRVFCNFLCDSEIGRLIKFTFKWAYHDLQLTFIWKFLWNSVESEESAAEEEVGGVGGAVIVSSLTALTDRCLEKLP